MGIIKFRHPNRWKVKTRFGLKGERRITRHHILPRSRGGTNDPENILALEEGRHAAWHKLFGLMTLEEAMCALQRLHRLKTANRHRFARNAA